MKELLLPSVKGLRAYTSWLSLSLGSIRLVSVRWFQAILETSICPLSHQASESTANRKKSVILIDMIYYLCQYQYHIYCCMGIWTLNASLQFLEVVLNSSFGDGFLLLVQFAFLIILAHINLLRFLLFLFLFCSIIFSPLLKHLQNELNFHNLLLEIPHKNKENTQIAYINKNDNKT